MVSEERVIVIGAGPAGMMAAVKAAENGSRVLLLEKMKLPGRKMRITGKGRCNVTNAADVTEIIKNIKGNGVFLNSSMRNFDNHDVMDFFTAQGVPLKVERGQRVFPVSDKAQDVVDAMVHRLHELDVSIMTETPVQDILTAGDGEERRVIGVRTRQGDIYKGRAVILAVGGASYPGTGSTGDGYDMAAAVGHTVTRITPALVPLETEEEWVRDVQGLSLRNVQATLLADGEEQASEFGEMLFTHYGVSGPIILSLSRTAAMLLADKHFVELSLDLKPALTMDKLDARIQRDLQKYQRKTMHNALVDLLPHKLISIVLDAAYIDPDEPVNQLTAAARTRLVTTLKGLMLTITRPRPLAEAIVTAGGVAVKEINPKTMESKLVHGLYFAGEVVDVDGYTGGYNLQAAFSMGAAAGQWAAWNMG